MKHYENPSNGSRFVPGGKTDRQTHDEAKSLFANLRMRLKRQVIFLISQRLLAFQDGLC